MSGCLERHPRGSGKEVLRQEGVPTSLGKDIPFPSSEQILRDATKEYKNNLGNSELLTKFMCAFWQEAGQKIGKNYTVSKFPLKSEEIKERTKNGQMAIFVPAEVSRVDLGRMFPKMKSWAVQEKNLAVDTINNSGWLWIETSVDAPNRNTTQRQLEEKFKKEKKQGQSLRNYIVGSQISKLLTDKYFDQRVTWSRLLVSYRGCWVLGARFNSVGCLSVNSDWFPGFCNENVGGRSEEVVYFTRK